MSVQQTEPPPVLLRNRLNVVGEDHSESGARRPLERAFAREMTGSASYWTEADFPDLHMKVGIREKRGGQGQAKDPSADLMEFRAVHGVAILIDAFGKLCDEASHVAGISGNSAGAAVTAFLTVNLKAFAAKRKRIVGTWEPTASGDVNAAVQAVYDNINKVLQTYVKIMRIAIDKAALDQQLKATRLLADKRASIDALLQPLLTAVGAPQTDKPGALAQEMRKQRSASMGLAAGWSDKTGVWKIGDGHVRDLMDGTAKVDMSKAHFVTRDDFNQAFEAWKLNKIQKLQQQKLQQQKLQQPAM